MLFSIFRITYLLIFLLSFGGFCFAFQKVPESDSIERSNLSKNETESNNLSKKWNKDSLQKAVNLFLNTSDGWAKLGENEKAAICLREAVNIKIILGEFRDLDSILQKSLKFDKNASNLAGEAEARGILSFIANLAGDSSESEKQIKLALDLIQKTDNVKAKARVNYYAGEFYYTRQDIQNLLTYFNKSLEYYRLTDDLKGLSRTLLMSAYADLATGDLYKGLSAARESIRISESGGEVRIATLSKIVEGRLLFRLGKVQTALDLYKQAEKVFPVDIDKTEKGVLLYGIGEVYEHFGECRQSIDYYQKTVDLLKQENNVPLVIGALWSLGSVSFYCGEKNLSIKYINESRQLAIQTEKNDDIATTYIKLAEVYFSEDNLEKALKNYQKAQQILSKNNYNGARILNGLGKIYAKRGELKLAREKFSAAFNINHSIKNNFAEAENLYYLADIYNREGNIEDALKSAQASIELSEKLSSEALNLKLRKIYFANIYQRYELLIKLLLKMHQSRSGQGFDLKALQAAEKSRSRSMIETMRLTEADFTKDADYDLINRENELRSRINLRADMLTDAISYNAGAEAVEQLSKDIEKLEDELEQLKVELKQNSPIYSAIKNPDPFDVREFQNRILDENSILLEFSLGETESYLWLVEKDEVSSYILPAREEIESKVENLRELIAARVRKKDETIENYQARVAEADKEYPEIARQLSDKLFGQIAGKLANKRLIIVPDGKLHYFPVSALPLPNSNDYKPILLSNEVVYEPSASTLLLIAKSEKQTKIPLRSSGFF